MGFGITNITAVTMDNITSITNVTNYPEFLINVNNMIYNGIFYFILLWIFWIIMFVAAQQVKNEPLINAMYSGAVVTMVSFFMRAITVVRHGIILGLLTDWQMWIFPLITIVIAAVIWGMKD